MKKIKLNLSDVTFTALSVDKSAKVCFYNGRILRLINTDFVETAYNLIKKGGLIEELIKKKLFINTWISNIEIEGYPLVLEHEIIERWIYPYEWSFEMLRDAGLLVLEVDTISNKFGYELMDGHAYNVTFNFNKPIYVDFGSFSIKQIRNPWRSYNIFLGHFYIPLILWSKGFSNTAKNIFFMSDYFDHKEYIKIRFPFLNLINNFIFNYLYKSYTYFIRLSFIKNDHERLKNVLVAYIVNFIKAFACNFFSKDKLKNKIKGLKRPITNSMWSNYHDDLDINSNKRFLRLSNIVSSLLDAKSSLEVAANHGKFSAFILENTHIREVIATDYDSEAVDIMYLLNKNKSKFKIYLSNFAIGGSHNGDTGITLRIKSDIVIALAVTHHLVISQGISLNHIFRQLGKLTNKYIIVEYMPLGLYAGDLNKTPAIPKDYYPEIFRHEFLNFFSLIMDEKIEKNRHVFVGKVLVNN